ncbi:MAG: hypothetical protein AAF481_14505 [Acidobacteriota bacterium]
MARPCSPNPRSRKRTVAYTAQEKAKVRAAAERHGLPPSVYARNQALRPVVSRRVPVEVVDELVEVGKRLNHCARLANTEGSIHLYSEDELREVLAALGEVLPRICSQ